MSRYSLGNQLRKRKELLYNLGAISSYSSMLIFLWHGIEMLISGEHPKHTLVLYAASSFFSILVMAPYKWDKKWMRIKTSVGIVVFGASLIIYLICVLMNWLWRQFVSLTLFKTCIVFLISLLLVGFIFWLWTVRKRLVGPNALCQLGRQPKRSSASMALVGLNMICICLLRECGIWCIAWPEVWQPLRVWIIRFKDFGLNSSPFQSTILPVNYTSDKPR